MREIEFLPDWYIKTQRHKKLLSLQFVCTLGLTIFFVGWSLFNVRTIARASFDLSERHSELKETADRVKERQTLLDYNQRLQNQSKVDASLGLNVESARILKLLDHIMPDSAATSEVTITTDEHPVAFTMPVALNSAESIRDLTRTMKVQIKGVAPSNEDVAAILEGLGNSKFCQSLKLSYSTDKIDKERILREFMIEFTIPLDSGKGQS